MRALVTVRHHGSNLCIDKSLCGQRPLVPVVVLLVVLACACGSD
jgi:hypothetical protein